MPSSHSRTKPSPTRPHLSEIINLYPDEEPYCAGYAPSQGRRCHNRTNARGRKTAMSLLNKGTKDLYAGRDIEGLLYELAPNVLCTRSHQSQDNNLVGKWLRKIDRFLDSYDDSPPTPTRPEPSRRKPEPRRRMSAQPSQAQNIPVQNRNRASEEETRWRSSFTSLEDLEALLEGHLAAASSTHQSTTAATSNNRVHSGSRTTRSLSSERRDMGDPDMSASATVRTSARPRELARPRTRGEQSNAASSRSTINTTRRPIEGDCSICLEPLLRTHGSDDGSDDSDIDSSDNESEEPEQEVVWCNAQCGNNYHKSCIERWLGTAAKSTCPTCRKPWRN
ncbi:hypothetical protein BDV19DRAFT_361025 [Aspergillus venezuelensis]